MAANVWWCQGYSEPNAGSDLASLKMQARRDGDHYVLNGSKIWTTAAHKADKIFCLVRTDNSGRKQEGISFLLVDMRLPGVEVRPIITLDGAQPPDHEVNQVFFDNVRVPISERLGEDGQGWECAKYLLSFERGNPVAPALKRKLGILRRAAEATGRCSDPVYRRKLTELRLCVEAVDALELALLKERIPEIDAAFVPSLLKCRGTEYDQEIEWLYSQTFGRNCIANLNLVQWEERYEGLAGSFAMRRYLNGRKKSIYGGTNEIQRGIIAKGRFGLRS
jgi:alkylation response protein AidB-like acyl-CoA dehydrogenase